MNWLRRLFRREPRPWLIQVFKGRCGEELYVQWIKVVCARKPQQQYVPCFGQLGLIGPFRSAVDADEALQQILAAPVNYPRKEEDQCTHQSEE